MNENVIMVNLYNGDMVIGEMTKNDEKEIGLDNPRAFVMMPIGGGQVSAAIQPLSFFSKKANKHIDIIKTQVMIVVENDELPKDMVSKYMTEVSGISIATPGEVSAINSTKESPSGLII